MVLVAIVMELSTVYPAGHHTVHIPILLILHKDA